MIYKHLATLSFSKANAAELIRLRSRGGGDLTQECKPAGRSCRTGADSLGTALQIGIPDLLAGSSLETEFPSFR